MTPENERNAFAASEEIAVRLRKANWRHPLCMAMVFITAVALYDRPLMMFGFCVLLGAQIVLGLFVIEPVNARRWRPGRVPILVLMTLCGWFWGLVAVWVCFARGYNRRNTPLRLFAVEWMRRFRWRLPETWRFSVLGVLLTAGMLWGALTAWSCFVFGYNHPNTRLILLYLVAMAIAGSSLFIHDLWLYRIFLAALLLPSILVHRPSPGIQGWIPVCALACCGMFLAVRMARLQPRLKIR